MNRTVIATLALLLVSAAASAPALAEQTREAGRPHLSFPATAADFQSRVEARLAKHREHLEAAITKKSIDATKAAELRARFEQGKAQVEAELAKVVADGTVTADEAKELHQVAKAAFPHHGHHGHHGQGGSGQPVAPDAGA